MLAIATTTAEEKFGHPFGIDGVYTRAQVQELLGNCSLDLVESLCANNRIWRGKLPGHRYVCICKRSVHKYLQSAAQ